MVRPFPIRDNARKITKPRENNPVDFAQCAPVVNAYRLPLENKKGSNFEATLTQPKRVVKDLAEGVTNLQRVVLFGIALNLGD